MHTTGLILAAVVALLHVYIFVLESFLWTTPYTRRIFGLSEAHAETTKVLAQNQGIYNLFLAAGIAWGLVSGPQLVARTSFFLVCIMIAGVVGALTASRRTLFVQTLPAAAALVALWLP